MNKLLNKPIFIQFIVYYVFLIAYTFSISLFIDDICPSSIEKNDIPNFDEIFLIYSLGAIFETITGSFLVILILRLFKFFRQVTL